MALAVVLGGAPRTGHNLHSTLFTSVSTPLPLDYNSGSGMGKSMDIRIGFLLGLDSRSSACPVDVLTKSLAPGRSIMHHVSQLYTAELWSYFLSFLLRHGYNVICTYIRPNAYISTFSQDLANPIC